MAREFNFDGIVGPTHNYSGLSHGNVASTSHQHQVSHPRSAAQQGLEKMKANFEAGIAQAVLPPLQRPRLEFLRALGFAGSDHQLVQQIGKTDPVLLATSYSASNMWTANAATVSPSADTGDGKVHFTPANLNSTMHRAIEARSTEAILGFVFQDNKHFQVHSPLPASNSLADEGAANHTRLCNRYGEAGIEFFVYGRSALGASDLQPTRYPARQTLEACQAIARRHQLDQKNTVVAQQNPAAIDAGVFHNDVISVGNGNLLLCHEQAFVKQALVLDELREKFQHVCGGELLVAEIPDSMLSIEDAVSSYLFNSQLVTLKSDGMMLVCPSECESNSAAQRAIKYLTGDDFPIDDVRYMDLRQSMNNGGGPACLRLRVVLTDAEAAAIHPGVVFDERLYERLVEWVTENYRESLASDDLKDTSLLEESRNAIESLAGILEIPLEILTA